MKHLILVLALMGLTAAPALGQWSDDFQSYADGSLLAGQGGWAGWDGGAAATTASGDHPKFAGDLAAKLLVNDDFVQQYSGYTSGKYTYTAMQYIPSTLAGQTGMQTFFILMNNYNVSGPKGWAVQMKFNMETGLVTDDESGSSASVPIVYDSWKEIKVEIDLEANTQATFYNGTAVATSDWYDPNDANHMKSVAAVDLWADVGGNPVYYDDMHLTPEPASMGLLALGGLLALRRRR